MTKTCKNCSVSKDHSEFSIKRRLRDGSVSLRENCKACVKDKDAMYYLKNSEQIKQRQRVYDRFARHGLSKEGYLKLLARFDGKCWLCKERPGLKIDHDHKCCSGAYSCGNCVRGVLCHQCNIGLGMFKDSISKLQDAIKYIS